MSQREVSFVPGQPSKALLPLAQNHHVFYFFVIVAQQGHSTHMEREKEDLLLQDEAVAM